MKCSKCGTEVNNPGISFCPTCGNYLKEINKVNEQEFYSPEIKVEEINNNEISNNIDFTSEKTVAVVKQSSNRKTIAISMILLGIFITALYMIVSGNVDN